MVDVEGVDVQLRVLSNEEIAAEQSKSKPGYNRKGEVAKNVKANRPRSPHPAVHDPGGLSPGKELESGDEDAENHLPTTADLAHSFLHAEPREEKAELQAAMESQSQYLQHSTISSQDGEEDQGTGTGTGLSLPGFVAGFLRGVCDRLELRVKRVELSLCLQIPAEGLNGTTSVNKAELVTLRLLIEDMDIESHFGGLDQREPAQGQDQASETSQTPSEKSDLIGRRCITLCNVRCMLVSDAALFNTLSRPPGPPSSSAAKANHIPTGHSQRTSCPPDSSSTSSDGLAMTHSTILHTSEESRPQSTKLQASLATSDGERFADAGIDGEDDAREISHCGAASVSGSSLLDDSTFPDQLSDSRFDDGNIEDSATLPAFALDSSATSLPADHDHNETTMRSSSSRINVAAVPSGGSRSIRVPQALDIVNKSHTGSLSQPLPLQGHRLVRANRTDNLVSGAQAFHQVSMSERDDDAAILSAAQDLSQSKFFSHEEAASMYMSAISHTSVKKGNDMTVPGGWEASSPTSDDAGTSSPIPAPVLASEESISLGRDHWPVAVGKSSMDMGDREDYDERSATSRSRSRFRIGEQSQDDVRLGIRLLPMQPHRGQDTRRLSTSNSSASPESSFSPQFIAKCVLDVDRCNIRLPITTSGSGESTSGVAIDTETNTASSGFSEMPGTFSRTPEQKRRSSRPRKAATRCIGKPELLKTSSRRDSDSTLLSDLAAGTSHDTAVDIQISTVRSQFDVSVGRLMAIIVQQLIASLDRHSSPTKSEDVAVPETSSIHSMKIEKVSLKLLEHFRGTALSSISESTIGYLDKPDPVDSDVLLASTIKGLNLSTLSSPDSSTVQLCIEKFFFGYATENILSFDAGLKMRDSIRDELTPNGKDLSISILRTRGACKINITTLPAHICLNLQRLDETFSWFGGFSSILELGSSMASMTTVVSADACRTQSPKRSRAVHFETTAEQDALGNSSRLSSNKANARIGGLVLDLTGRLCSIRLESTAMKLVSREEGIGLQVDIVKLDGPYLVDEDREPSITARLTNIRVEYLSTPKEVDLGRLLSLLTPSADKYDQDDDILVETLLRQRRQGAVLRVTLASVKAEIMDVDSFKYFPTLVDDVSKLSTVAKYLPEDDRPGILILGLIRDLDFHVSANKAVGDVQFTTQNLEVAHVGLPSLLALCIERLRLHRNHDEELVGEAIASNPPTPHARTPMVMARMIGDEMEPTIKIKLWNVRTEYRVPTITAVLGLSDTMTAEDVVADMVSSVVTLTDRHLHENVKSTKPSSESSSSSAQTTSGSRPMKLDIVLRDSVIGLNPQNLPHRGLVVLTDTRFSGSILKKDNAFATLEIKKATFLVIDDMDNIAPAEELSRSDSVEEGMSQVQEFCNMGYVAVSYISSAKAQINVSDPGGSGEKSIDIELRDDLFVLESCADSTQTMLGILNGLKPPMPPSKEIKFRTEIVPVQDMLASLSGDAFAQVMPPQNEGYDVPLDLDEGDMVDDDVPQNFEFVNSFYRHELEPTSDEIADSMLEDDLGRLANPPITRKIGDKNLLESFREQYEIAPGGEPLDFREDHFGTRSAFQGKAHRWNSAQNTYGLENDYKVRGSPLRVRVRDVHFIWNLFDGYDWQKTRDIISKAVKDVEIKATERRTRNDRRVSLDADEEEESVIGDFLFNSIYIGIPANRDPRELSHQINRNVVDHASETESYSTSTVSGSPSRQSKAPHVKRKKLRLNRSKHHKMTFELKGVSADLVVFPPGSGEAQSSIDVRVKDFEIFDHVPTSTWKKFATYMQDAGERESDTSMIHLEIMNIKPVPELAASEIVLKVRLPIF